MHLLTTIAAAAALTVLASCGGTNESSPEATEAPPTPTQTQTTPAQPSSYTLGEQVDFTADDDTEFNVTIVDYKKDQPHDDSVEAGERLDVLLVKACNISFEDDPNGSDLGTILGFENFQLRDSDSGSYSELDLTPSPAPKPQIDTFAVLTPGECAKGWLAFAIPGGTELVQATYSANNELLATWIL